MISPFVFLAWQSATERRWYTVGRLERQPAGSFEFVYTRGLSKAVEAGMAPLAGMPLSNQRYLSQNLFPIFQNRLMSPSRDDYALHLERLGLTGQTDPLLILARSGGRRETDSYQVFPAPYERRTTSNEREICVQFFIHGFRYMPGDTVGNAGGRPLFLMWDFQNPKDAQALMIRTEDNHSLGWVPRYYNKILLRLREMGVPIAVKAEHINPPGSPPWYRILCSVTAPWPEGYDPMTEEEEYHPLV